MLSRRSVGITEKINFCAEQTQCFLKELFSVLQSGLKTKVYCHVSTPCTTGCRLRHCGWRKYSQKKWLEKVSLHRTAWELLRGLLKPVAASERLLLTQEWPKLNDLWQDPLYLQVASELGLLEGKVVDRCAYDFVFKQWYFATNSKRWVQLFPKRKCDQLHEHVQVELKDSGFYPKELGIDLLKTALSVQESLRGGVKNPNHHPTISAYLPDVRPAGCTRENIHTDLKTQGCNRRERLGTGDPLVSRESLIEPLRIEQGAPTTSEEEVMTGSWSFCQEEGGRWPWGRGGPVVSQGQMPCTNPVGASGQEDFSTEDFPFLVPSPCQQVRDASETAPAYPTPNLVLQQEAAPEEKGELSAVAPTVNLWRAILSGLEAGCESTVVTAISSLQDSGQLREDTFEWTAADLAMNSIQESNPDCRRQAAVSAARDVIGNLGVHTARGPLQVLVFNATTWRSSLTAWCTELRPDLIFVQETHLVEANCATIAQQFAAYGYVASTLPAVATGRGGCSGGLALLHRQHLDVKHVLQFSLKGAGFLASEMRVKGFDLFVVTVYLQSGEGFQSAVNSEVLSRLIPFLKSVKGAYFVAGDFNDDLETLVATHIADEARGVWLGPGEPTVTGGGQIDLALVSKSLAPLTEVSLDWATPFKPHAALRWSLNLGAVCTLVPQLRGFQPCDPKPQAFVPCHTDRTLVLLDLPVDSKLTRAFADLSFASELAAFGVSRGRGAAVECKRSPLQFQGIPQSAWGGRTAALWSRFLSWVRAVPTHGARGGSFIESFLRQLEQVWHGPSDTCDLFRAQVAKLLEDSQGQLDDQLVCEATAQHHHHSKVWLQSQAAAYRKWLGASTVKGMRPLFRVIRKHEATFDRPFRDKSLLDRVYHRWQQWHEIWCQEIVTEPGLLAKLKSKAIEQAHDLPPIPLQDAVKLFRHFPCKAPGADGWTPQLLRQLPEPAIQAILDFFRECELCADWPAQFAVNLIVLLPKSLKRERPIALLHVLYRAYVRLRWPLVACWQSHYSRIGTWDKAMPGSGVLDIALSRLVRGEAARQHKEHLCTLFLDLETFYDRCRFADVIHSGLSLGYPPLILHQALLVYQAPRYLQGEGTLAPQITPTSGVLAGCPAAPSVSKLIIHPIAAKLVARPGTTNLDLWIDDLSLDSVRACPQQLASDCVRLYRGLAESLCDMGAKVSLEKTCFVTSSAAASKALSAVRRPDDPQVKMMARDLGVTSAGTRRRLLGLAATRRAKAGARSKKLNTLGVPGLSHRIRIVKSSIVSAGLWGHQSLGVSPKRRKWYRTLCGRHLGRQKMGSLDVIFALLEAKCEDPHFTILRQHFRAVCRVFARWAANDYNKFESTWGSLWHHLQQAPAPWKRVTGPVSATIAYLMDLGVVAPESRTWRHEQGVLHLDWCNPDASRSAWQWLVQILRAQQFLRIASQEGCEQLAQGIDFTVPRKLAKRNHVHRNTRTGLMAVWQGSLPGVTKQGWCRACACKLTVQHALWECPYLSNRFPDTFADSRSLYPWPSLWLRGLVPKLPSLHPAAEPSAYGIREEGIFRDQNCLGGDGLVFATDASGGPGGGDERMQFTCWAFGAYVLEPSGPQRVGCVSYLQPFHMSVPQAEQQALFELLLRVHSPIDVTIDCKSVQQILKKSVPPIEGQVPWGTVWQKRSYAKVTWVNSHKSAEFFAQKGWPQWRREINEDIDGVCRARVQEVFLGSHKVWLRNLDHTVQEVCYHLGRKANYIHQHRRDSDFPWVLKVPGEHQLCFSPTPKALVVPNPTFCKTTAPNKKQRMLALLSGTDDSLGHQWIKGAHGPTNITMKCEVCGLYVQQITDQASFNRLMQHPCVGRGEPLPQWGIHGSHDMVNMGVQWSCSKCGRLQRPQHAVGAKNLQKPCDGRAPVSQLGKLAQRAHNHSLSESSPAIPVQKVSVPFGTKKAESPAVDKGPKQAVLQFGAPPVVNVPKKAQPKASQKQAKLSFQATKPSTPPP